jgi:hypothetical protein
MKRSLSIFDEDIGTRHHFADMLNNWFICHSNIDEFLILAGKTYSQCYGSMTVSSNDSKITEIISTLYEQSSVGTLLSLRCTRSFTSKACKLGSGLHEPIYE